MNVNKFYSEVVDSYNKTDRLCDKPYCFLRLFKKYIYDYYNEFSSSDFTETDFFVQAIEKIREHGFEANSGCLRQMIYIMKKFNIPIEKITNFLGFDYFSSYCRMCYKYKDKKALIEFIKYLTKNDTTMEIE